MLKHQVVRKCCSVSEWKVLNILYDMSDRSLYVTLSNKPDLNHPC